MLKSHRLIQKTKYLILMSFFCISTAYASSSVVIWPLSPVIEDEEKAASLWLQNNHNESTYLQIRVLKWQQVNGEDVYSEQKDVLSSPPATEIKPGQKQLIRLIKSQSVAAGTESSYRILIDEIPRSDLKQAETGVNYGVSFQMRYSLPLFVQGKGIWTNKDVEKKRDMADATQPNVTYQIQNKAGKRWLTVENKGNVHARLAQVKFGNSVVSDGLLGYVLPGKTMSFPLPAKVNTTGSLEAIINDQPTPTVINK